MLARLPSELTAPHATMQLASCLQAFGAPETLQGDDAYSCEVCSKRAVARAAAEGRELTAEQKRGQPALKWLQVSKMPKALTLHIKRFRSMGRRVNKIDTHVPFPPVLNISPFACAGEPAKHYSELRADGPAAAGAAAAPAEGNFQLYGVVEHQGSFSGGHYVAFVHLSGLWYRMSDSQVSLVPESDVYQAQAFLVFYERVDSRESSES